MTKEEKFFGVHIYDPNDQEVLERQAEAFAKLAKLNSLPANDFKAIRKMMKTMLAECGENCFITLPIYSSFGLKHVHFGNNVYCNFNATFIDDSNIFIGNNVLIAPNCTFATAAHPIRPDMRKKGYQYNVDIHIGDNVWIGAGVIVLPGVNVGENSVIGAGSVVTKSIPANVIAAGNPCRVLREINERDYTYFYKQKRFDEEPK